MLYKELCGRAYLGGLDKNRLDCIDDVIVNTTVEKIRRRNLTLANSLESKAPGDTMYSVSQIVVHELSFDRSLKRIETYKNMPVNLPESLYQRASAALDHTNGPALGVSRSIISLQIPAS